MPLQVLGASFGRTGTSSLQEALRILGYPCYHMSVLMPDCLNSYINGTRSIAAWMSYSDQKTHGDWEAVFRHHTAAVDFPCCLVYKEMLERYPDLKVIFIDRDFDSWYKSAMDTIYKISIKVSTMPWLFRMSYWPLERFCRVDSLIFHSPHSPFKGRFEDKAFAREAYEKHRRDVIQSIPPKQMLVFKLKEGWQPLCEFLGKDVPACPFPNVNDSAAFKTTFMRTITHACYIAYLMPLVWAFLAWVIIQLMLRISSQSLG